MATLQWRVKEKGDLQWGEWEEEYETVRFNHSLVELDDIEVRVTPEFVPSYYRDNLDGEVVYHTEEPNLRYWTRVKVIDNETGDEYTSAE